MKIMDRLSRILGSRDQATNEPEDHVLGPFEVRLIAEGKLERLAEFAASSRLHAADPKGDTPLHLAARMGNLAVCDLFIRSGADPAALNHDRQTPADVAFAEGHGLAAQLLSSLVAGSTETETVGESEVSLGVETVVAAPDSAPEHRIAGVQETEPADRANDADIDTGRRAFLGNPGTMPAEPATVVTKLHHIVADAVKRVQNLEFDKTRTPTQQHDAGRKLAEATVEEFTKARTAIKKWSDRESAAALKDIRASFAPEPGKGALYSEIRAFCLARKGDPEFVGELRSLVETNRDFAAALLDAPAVLSGLSAERQQQLTVNAASKHAPEASERLQQAVAVGELDAKLAAAQAEVAPAFYNTGVQEGMRTAVDISAPLGGE